MSKISINLEESDWVWLIEFLDQTLREVEDLETTEDILRLQSILRRALDE